jgi:hypothetical protein
MFAGSAPRCRQSVTSTNFFAVNSGVALVGYRVLVCDRDWKRAAAAVTSVVTSFQQAGPALETNDTGGCTRRRLLTFVGWAREFGEGTN